MIYIGIDTGVNTGIAIWDSEKKAFRLIATTKIHRAMAVVKEYAVKQNIVVRCEDARKRTWFGTHTAKEDRARLQGAGSVKRDCGIWEDYLNDLNVSFEMVAPKNNATKMSAESFKRLTGWKERTNEHGRDAAMLVFGF